MSIAEIYSLQDNFWKSANTIPVVVPPGPTTDWIYGPGGTYKPDGAHSGIPAGFTPVDYVAAGSPYGKISNGQLVVRDSNVHIDGYDIPARITPYGTGIHVTRCAVRGTNVPVTYPAGLSIALVNCANSTVKDFVIEDSLLAPSYPNYGWNGIYGHDFIVRRCDITSVDAVGMFNTDNPNGDLNAGVYASMLGGSGGLHYFSPDGNHPHDADPRGSHSDCCQIQGGAGAELKWNNFYGFYNPAVGQANVSPSSPQPPVGGFGSWNPYWSATGILPSNSCLQVTQGVGLVRGLVFEENWCDGGRASLNLNYNGGIKGSIGRVANNKFGRNQGLQGSGGDNTYTILSTGFTFDDLSGNVYEDNAHPVYLASTRIAA